MEILLVSQFYEPETVAAAFRATDNSKVWADLGNYVTIFTGYPNFPRGKIFEGYDNKVIICENHKNRRVIRSKISIKKNTNILNRAINATSFVFWAIFNIIFNKKKIGKKFDVVIGTSGTIFSGIIGYIFSKVYKCKYIFELRDITFIQFKAVYGERKKLLYNIIRYVELYLCKKAESIVVVTNGYKEILDNEGIDINKINVIRNGVLFEGLDKTIVNNKTKSNKLRISYIGNIGKSQRIVEIVNIFKEIKYENKELLIIGDGAEKEYLINNFGQDHNIKILGSMDKRKISYYYDISDFSIVSLKNDINFKHTIPSKIFEIMAMKTAILFFGPRGEAWDIVEEADCGYCFEELNALDIESILNINIEILGQKAINGYNYCEKNFNRYNLAKQYLEIINCTL